MKIRSGGRSGHPREAVYGPREPVYGPRGAVYGSRAVYGLPEAVYGRKQHSMSVCMYVLVYPEVYQHQHQPQMLRLMMQGCPMQQLVQQQREECYKERQERQERWEYQQYIWANRQTIAYTPYIY